MGNGNVPSQNTTAGFTPKVLRHCNKQLRQKAQWRTCRKPSAEGYSGCEGQDGGLSVASLSSTTDKQRSIEKLILQRKLSQNVLGSLQTTYIYSSNSHIVPVLHTATTLAVLLLFLVSCKEQLIVKSQHLLIKRIDFCYPHSDQRICSWHRANLVYRGEKRKGNNQHHSIKIALCWKRNPYQGVNCPGG